MRSSPSDLHALEPEDFIDEVHSFEHWFGSVSSYLTDLDHGHRTDLEDTGLDERRRDRLTTLICNYVVGETAALEASSGLIRIAPNRHARIFLATQVADEARHVEVMQHRLRELGVADPERETERRAGRSIRNFRAKLLELVDGRDWDSAIFAQNVVLEAMESAVFGAHARVADPVTRDMLERILRDERRHIGFGENEIARRLRAEPERRTTIAAIKRELDSLAIRTFEDALDDLDVPRSERPPIGRRYRESIDRLGF
jgi:rubrerythrin